MNNFSRDEFIIIRITDYKDNKSIVKALGRRSGLTSFAVKKHKNYKSPFAGKIHKLNILNAELYQSERHLYLSNINKTYHTPHPKNITEYEGQQKLLMLLEKISQHTVDTNVFESIYEILIKQKSLNKNLPIILCKIMDSLNIFEKDKNLHPANYLFIDENGIINNKQGNIKISGNTYKVIQYYIKKNIQETQKLELSKEIKSEIEYIFTQLLQLKYNTLINFRNLNDIFNSIQLHNQAN